jgi:membrane protease YdiL (CAAX protease family)
MLLLLKEKSTPMIKSLFWNDAQRRLRAFWRQIIQLVVLFLAVAIVSNNLSPVLQFVSSLLTPNADMYLAFDFSSWPLLELLTALIVLETVWLMARFINREPFGAFGFRFNGNWWLDYGFGLVLGFLLTAGVFLVELAAGWVTIAGTFWVNIGLGNLPFGFALLSPLVSFAGIAIFEETATRAYPIRNLAQGLQAKVGPRGALVSIWLLSAIAFAWGHHTNPHVLPLGFINLGIAGLLLGLSYVLTGNLGLSLGLHISWDFCQGCVFGMPVAGMTPSIVVSFLTIVQGGPELWTGGDFGPDGGLVVTLAFLLGMLSVLLYVRWRYGKVALSTPLATYLPRRGGADSDLSVR